MSNIYNLKLCQALSEFSQFPDGAVCWVFLVGPLPGAGTLVGPPTFGRRVVLTLVRTPDAVIADGPGGIAPDLTSTAAAETPNQCTELGQAFVFFRHVPLPTRYDSS